MWEPYSVTTTYVRVDRSVIVILLDLSIVHCYSRPFIVRIHYYLGDVGEDEGAKGKSTDDDAADHSLAMREVLPIALNGRNVLQLTTSYYPKGDRSKAHRVQHDKRPRTLQPD